MATGPRFAHPAVLVVGSFPFRSLTPEGVVARAPGVHVPATGAGYRALGIRPPPVPVSAEGR